jgi:glyoxylase-like metal-dependent hydrolase (beta-lactamase superfamily II)
MNRIKFILSGLFLLVSYQSLAGTPVPDYNTHQVAEHTHVIFGPTQRPNRENLGFMNNPALIIGTDSVIIVDPGSSLESGRMVLRQLKKLTDKPVSHVFISHVHGDHWLGNQAVREVYPDAKLYAHPEMIRLAKESEAQAWLERMNTLTEGATEGTHAVIPEIPVADGDVFKISGLTVRAYIMPAVHSNTDAMYEIVEDSVMLTGDNVTSQRMPRFDHGTFRGTISMTDMLLTKEIDYFVPGHGPGGDRKIIEDYRNYIVTLYDTVKALYEEGLSDFEMKDKVVAKLSAYKQWSMFEDSVGKHISLAILEAEKAAFE